MSFDNTIKPSQNLWLKTPLMPVSFSRLRLSGTIDLPKYAVVMMEELLDPGTLFPPVQITNTYHCPNFAYVKLQLFLFLWNQHLLNRNLRPNNFKSYGNWKFITCKTCKVLSTAIYDATIKYPWDLRDRDAPETTKFETNISEIQVLSYFQYHQC